MPRAIVTVGPQRHACVRILNCGVVVVSDTAQRISRDEYIALTVHGDGPCRITGGPRAIIVAIRRIERGLYMTIVDSDDANEATRKTVILSSTIPNAVSLMHIDLGYATTAMAVQGKEFPRVAFWNNTKPGAHWTRSSAYVAISRGKEQSIVIGSRRDFETICMNKDPHRRTVLREVFIDSFAEITKAKAIPALSGIRDVSTLTVAGTSEPCVKTLKMVRMEVIKAHDENHNEDFGTVLMAMIRGAIGAGDEDDD